MHPAGPTGSESLSCRRSTGGLGLWHAAGDLVWSLVLPRSDPRVGNDFLKAYRRLGAAAVQLLAGLGVSATWRLPNGPRTASTCLLSGRGEVLTVDERARSEGLPNISLGTRCCIMACCRIDSSRGDCRNSLTYRRRWWIGP